MQGLQMISFLCNWLMIIEIKKQYQKTDMPVIISWTRATIPVPDSSNIHSSYEFTLTSSCVSKCHDFMSNLNMLGEEIENKHVDSLDHF